MSEKPHDLHMTTAPSHEAAAPSFSIKLLAIIGFSATILLIGWAILMLVTKGQATFSSLASKAETIDSYRPAQELILTAEKSVVNADEKFKLSWTDMKQDGLFKLSYTCTPDVIVHASNSQGKMQEVPCEMPIEIPGTVHELTFSISSRAMRFSEIPFTIVFNSTDTKVTAEADLMVTVLNVSLPTTPTPVPQAPVTKPATTTPVTTVKPTPTTPVYTAPKIVYPVSDANGYTDLRISTLGSGVMNNGVFQFTREYDDDWTNAVVIDIENIGTKTSDLWSFTTTLPDGTKYNSPTQFALKPKEHAVFTIHFVIDDTDDTRIVSTVYTSRDTISTNNKSTLNVEVD